MKDNFKFTQDDCAIIYSATYQTGDTYLITWNSSRGKSHSCYYSKDELASYIYKYGWKILEDESEPLKVAQNMTVNFNLQLNSEPANEYIESLQGNLLTLSEEASEICAPSCECAIGSDLELIKQFTKDFPVSVLIVDGKYVVYSNGDDFFAEDDFALGKIVGSIRTLEEAR